MDDPTLQMVERFEELLPRQHDRYAFSSIFSAEGFFARRASQKKLRLLKRLDGRLRAMFWPDEKVLFLATGVPYSVLEAYFLGHFFYYLSLRALVLTNERLILIQVDSRHRPGHLKSQLLLTDIQQIAGTGLGNTRVRLRSGKKYVLASVPRRDRKRLAALLAEAQARAHKTGPAGDLTQLCPHCYTGIPDRPATCASCGKRLKSTTRAVLFSLLFPGTGTIYLGYPRFGIFKVALGLVCWFDAWSLASRPEVPLGTRVATSVIFLALVHGVAALTTLLLARKGHYPEQPDANARPSALASS